jgi:predicted HTH transcriptional regulator
MDLRELEQIVRDGREGFGVEFKQSMNWADDAAKAKVVKAALAMVNKRDGGILIFGLTAPANAGLHTFDGMPRADYESFNQDDVMAKVNAHASPSIDLTVHHVTIDGKQCVAIEIREFAEYPVMCSNDLVVTGRVFVSKGRVYCRSRRMPESTEVRSAEDMRDIIEIAIDKGLNRYLRRRAIEDQVGRTVDDAEKFRRQRGDL